MGRRWHGRSLPLAPTRVVPTGEKNVDSPQFTESRPEDPFTKEGVFCPNVPPDTRKMKDHLTSVDAGTLLVRVLFYRRSTRDGSSFFLCVFHDHRNPSTCVGPYRRRSKEQIPPTHRPPRCVWTPPNPDVGYAGPTPEGSLGVGGTGGRTLGPPTDPLEVPHVNVRHETPPPVPQ